MTAGLADVRYALRSLIDQVVGYCEVIVQRPEASALEPLRAGVEDVCSIARSIGPSLDAPKLNARQLENLGQRVLTLSSHISFRSADLLRFAIEQGQTALAPDLDRLRAVAGNLLPLAEQLIVNHASLARESDATQSDRHPAHTAPTRLDASSTDQSTSPLLIVDDNETNRDLLTRRLTRAGYSSLVEAKNGREALELLRRHDFDLVLLDVMMPEIDGMGVLREMKQDERLRDIPVVMISAVDDVASVAQCIELGADDYLPKPFDQIILRARIRGSLERKRLRDADKRRTAALEQALLEVRKAREVAEDLLRNILPATVAEELQEKNAVDPMYFEDVTIVFTDFVGFTAATEKLSAEELVYVLHAYFTGMDRIIDRYGLEKLKTIGDSYMFVGGLPARNPAHPVDALLAAFDILDFVAEMKRSGKGADWSIRIGVHTGPVIAGVVGVRKFAFDVWGESVNIASRLESAGIGDQINMSERTYTRVKDFFLCEPRGKVETKEGYELDMYIAKSIQPKLMGESSGLPPAFARRYRTYFARDLREFPTSLSLPC